MHCIESWEYDDQWMAKKLEQCLVPILTEIFENDHFVIFMIVTIYCEPAIDDVNQCNFVDRGSDEVNDHVTKITCLPLAVINLAVQKHRFILEFSNQEGIKKK